MPLVVGNLLEDPAATSFISLADADEYITAEAGGVNTGTAMGDWLTAGSDARESSLVRASRWMASTLPWCSTTLSGGDMVRVGHVATRIAVEAFTVDLWAAESVGKDAKRYKAGSVEVEYQDRGQKRGAEAGGKRFPWAYPMLRGLMCGGNGQHDVVRR